MIVIKQGDPYRKEVFVTDEQGNAVNITGWRIHSQIRQNGRLLATLDCAVVDGAAGKWRYEFVSTDSWKAGFYDQDIAYFINTDEPSTTETFRLQVIKRETWVSSHGN